MISNGLLPCYSEPQIYLGHDAVAPAGSVAPGGSEGHGRAWRACPKLQLALSTHVDDFKVTASDPNMMWFIGMVKRAFGEPTVEEAFINITGHLLGANQKALNLRIVGFRLIGTTLNIDPVARLLKEPCRGLLQGALGDAQPQNFR